MNIADKNSDGWPERIGTLIGLVIVLMVFASLIYSIASVYL